MNDVALARRVHAKHPHPVGPGVQHHWVFPNGYGASVVRFHLELPNGKTMGGSYGSESGLWELGVIGRDGKLTYDTPITSDVEGYLTPSEVRVLLRRIEAL